jgi:drug/metabolite transporter (DMT)-like permease
LSGPGGIRREALVLFLATPAMFATNLLVARGLEGAVPPVALAFGRWMLTFLMLAPIGWLPLWRQRRQALAEWPVLLLLGLLGMGFCGAPIYQAGITTTATNMGLIYAASPILIVALGRLFWGDPAGPRQAVGIVLCLAGVVVVIAKGDPAVLLGLQVTGGDLWVALATVSWAVYSLLIRHRPGRLDLRARFAAITLAGVLVNLPAVIAESAVAGLPALDLRVVGIVVLLALVPGLGAFLAYNRLVALIGPASTGLIMYLVPLYNAGLAFLLLGERPQLYHLAGAALILPGIWAATRPAGRPGRED